MARSFVRAHDYLPWLSLDSFLFWTSALAGDCSYSCWWRSFIYCFQRGRFRSDQEGPGVIQVVEGQIAYFGPSEGGLVAISDLSRISLVMHNRERCWQLDQAGLATIYIPVTAKGTDHLFDAFATLPGLKIENMVQKLTQDSSKTILIWERNDISSSKIYLH